MSKATLQSKELLGAQRVEKCNFTNCLENKHLVEKKRHKYTIDYVLMCKQRKAKTEADAVKEKKKWSSSH